MITQVVLENFRNFPHFSTNTLPVTVILGPNGSGKSSLVEAIALLGGHRFSNTLQELIKWDETYARIELSFDSGTYRTVRLVVQPKTVRIFGDDQSISVAAALGTVPSVYFSPRSVTLLEDAPSYRRKFLDQLLFMVSGEYRETLHSYLQTLRQRNAALTLGNSLQHEVWEAALSEHGAYITLARNWMLRQISKEYASNGHIHYTMSPKSGTDLLPLEGSLAQNLAESKNELKTFLQDKWLALREKERKVGFTLMGPQRDDWYIDGESETQKPFNIGIYGSRGQQRMAVLALQKAALVLLEKHLAVKPVWILDDVFSELDEKNHNQIYSIIKHYQTFVTSANNKDIGLMKLQENSNTKVIMLGK